ncbi:hypothetical protein L6452_08628 [Arctium lappa]|uniref:Uncharacterized protein n=1 Tax=Arctium lappa TaxID=4217 RepID=A0ACB9DHT0_ARCLA|nr:hypothetical protein L6452_08628 [Arctium lappa]
MIGDSRESVLWVSGIEKDEGEGLMSFSIYRRFSGGHERLRSSKDKNENRSIMMKFPASTNAHLRNLNTNVDDIDVNNGEGLLYIGSNSDDGTDTNESEFLVDDSNNLDGIDVDMKDFMEKLETESDWVGLPINNQVLDGSNVDVDPEPDRQKGIIPAMKKVFPCVEHRFCLRHIHENMKLQWKGKAFKDSLWKCATATTIPHFEHSMEELKCLSKGAYEWLKQIDPHHWSRSHFTERCHSDILLNNMCEVFNKQLVDGRDKPIITALEYIREYLMKRIVKVQKLIENADGPLTPTATKMMNSIKEESTKERPTKCPFFCRTSTPAAAVVVTTRSQPYHKQMLLPKSDRKPAAVATLPRFSDRLLSVQPTPLLSSFAQNFFHVTSTTATAL